MPVPARRTEGRPTASNRSRPAGIASLLARHPGTVTDLLERLAGEPIDADVRHQRVDRAEPGHPLGLDVDEELVVRAVLLRGRRTGLAYVYAESSIAPARLPATVRRRLEQSRDPIGRILDDHRLTVERQPLPGAASPTEADRVVAALLAEAPVSRRYRILVAGRPAFAVDEWFLPPAEALVHPPG